MMASPQEAPNLGVALWWAGKGVPVFPCHQDKRPATPHGFYDATTDPEQIRAWWAGHPDALVGFPTGKASGIVALDSDKREHYDGEDALGELERQHGALPNTITVLTPSGGQHRYFKAPEAVIKNSAGLLGEGLDVRGDGGYVIAAESQLKDGRCYDVELSSPPEMAEMPAWMLRKLGDAPRPQKAPEPPKAGALGPGRRNDYLASYAGRMAHAGFDADQIRAALHAENERACNPPLPAAELERTVLRSTATRWVKTGETVTELEDLPPPPKLALFKRWAFPQQTPLLGPICTQQLVLVHAPTGTGKTLWALAMNHAVSTGGALHGWEAPEAVPALYVDGEMPGAMMQGRLEHAESDNLYMANIQQWAMQVGYPPVNLANPDGQAIIEAWIKQTGARIVTLDNFISLAEVNVSLSSDEYWAPVRSWMMRLRGQGVTVVLIDHSNDSGTLHGTKSRTWQMDLNIVLRAIESEPESHGFVQRINAKRLLLQFQKARHGDGGAEFEDREITMAPIGQDWPWRSAQAGLHERVARMVENGMPYDAIVHETGISKSTLYRLHPRGRNK